MIAETLHRKLLVVDDEPLVRETLDFCLRDDYEITLVASGEEAIEASRREEFPVVLLDLRMEGLSGLETLKRLKQIDESQSVIILTAYESMESAIAALNLGAFNYLTKPFESRHLKEVISKGFEVHDQHSLRQREFQRRFMNVHDTFLSMLCHEFNTPLNTIIGVSELLLDKPRDKEQKEWLQEIRNSGTHLHDILMEIVDYVAASHMAAGGAQKEFVLEELLRPVADAFVKDGRLFDFEESPAWAKRYWGPAHSIAIIARKLGRMASHQSHRTRLHAELRQSEEGEQTLVLKIRGTGIFLHRIGQKEMAHLFEPYQFATYDPSGGRTSLGLELATCRRIAEYARGLVGCNVDPQEEIEFFAEIPVREVV